VTDTSNIISDDFSDDDNDAPSSPPKVPDDARKLPSGPRVGLYAPTSDIKPMANPDPLQRRAAATVPPQLSATGDGEPLFCAETSRCLH
jgi:hypothetical protein